MVSVLASSAEDRGFEPWSCQTKDYKIDNLLLLCYKACSNKEKEEKTGLFRIRIMF